MSVGCEYVIASWASVYKPPLDKILCFCVETARNTHRFWCCLFCNFWLRTSNSSYSVRASGLSELVSVNAAYLGPQELLVAVRLVGRIVSTVPSSFYFPFCLALTVAILEAISLVWFCVKKCTAQINKLRFLFSKCCQWEPPNLLCQS